MDAKGVSNFTVENCQDDQEIAMNGTYKLVAPLVYP